MILAYKAFHPDMTCRNFQYKLGRWYEQYEPAKLCHKGFHACILPQHVLKHYPSDSIFAKVLLDDIDYDISGDELLYDSKICGRKIYVFPYTLTFDELVKENINVLDFLLRIKECGREMEDYHYIIRLLHYLHNSNTHAETIWFYYILLNLNDRELAVEDFLKRIEEEQRKAGMF